MREFSKLTAEQTMDISGGYVPVVPTPVFPTPEIAKKIVPFVTKVALRLVQMFF